MRDPAVILGTFLETCIPAACVDRLETNPSYDCLFILEMQSQRHIAITSLIYLLYEARFKAATVRWVLFLTWIDCEKPE